MGSDIEIIGERLESFLGQLQTEYGILDRIVYKNKNQHRRSSYFQHLLKVRRDLRLLQSTKLEELLASSFQVIKGTRPKQKVQLLERVSEGTAMKRRKCDGQKFNFLERILGAARLLSQKLLKIGSGKSRERKGEEKWIPQEPQESNTSMREVSTLLAQSFFMGFSLTVLALLARMRVLVQQILLDVVEMFNTVSSLSQKEHSVKITHEGFEAFLCKVFREYYPTNEQSVLLECVWETDKFVLHERISKSQTKSCDKFMDAISLGASKIQYQSVESFLGDDETGKVDPSKTSEGLTYSKVNNDGSLEGPVIESEGENQVKSILKAGDNSDVAATPIKKPCETGSSSFPSSSSPKFMSGSRSKVAFLSVKVPTTSTANLTGPCIMGTGGQDNEKEDPFFDLLTGGNRKNSLF
ncbi:unnamed protein product, partial [Thlaspi arvense]